LCLICSTKEVLGEKGQRIRELTMAVQKRFGFPEGTVEMFAERVHNRGLSAMAQAESLKYKLLGGLQVGRLQQKNLRCESTHSWVATGPKGMLRCHSLRYGERRARNRGYCVGQGPCSACQVNEVQVRIPHHDWPPSECELCNCKLFLQVSVSLLSTRNQCKQKSRQ
jgi:ribosomal protein S3